MAGESGGECERVCENESNRKTGREKWEGHINIYLVLEEVFVV